MRRGPWQCPTERYHRQVIRRRRQLLRDRVRTQSRVKAELRFYGIHLEEPRGKWTQIYFETLRNIKFGNRGCRKALTACLSSMSF
jgi:transposase